MIKNILVFILSYFLILAQASFMSHFYLFGFVPNIVVLLVVVWNLLERKEEKSGLYFAFMSGFFADIFSSGIIGINVLIFTTTAVLLKFFLRKYVRIPFIEKN